MILSQISIGAITSLNSSGESKQKPRVVVRFFNYFLEGCRAWLWFVCLFVILNACIPSLVKKNENRNVPATYSNNGQDTTNTAKYRWRDFYTDPYLVELIDTALNNNQQLNIILQDIVIANNLVRAKKGQYLPFVGLFGGASVDKVGKYTALGAIENNANVNLLPGQPIPEILPNYLLGANVSWQLDVWKQLRNAKKSAFYSYLATIEGKSFIITLLISDIATNYYELMALDNQLEILKATIEIQINALEIVQLQKQAGIVTELAVRRFEAEVAKNQSRQFYLQQKIIETENRINFLVGRYPRFIPRSSKTFNDLIPTAISSGIPSQLLQNRPDIRQAEQALAAAKLDIKVAKANFYPVVNITGGIGYSAFNPGRLLATPQSLLFNLAGGLSQPLINRNAIKADYYSANARQIQAVYDYERTVLNAYTEVSNQLANISNLEKSYVLKTKQVEALNRSINISISLFKSAMADYMEVLLTQRDALEARMELVETKKQQMNAVVKMYQVLGGGW